MPKGAFTQGVCVLVERVPSLDEVAGALDAFNVQGRHAAGESWMMGGPAVRIAFRIERNGQCLADVVDRAWPPGEPSDHDLQAAFGMGHFGPFAHPGSLRRAVDQAWAWPEAREVVPRHRAFVRLRTSYVLGGPADPAAGPLPPDYDPVAELAWLSEVAQPLLALPGALAWFAPSGEVVRSADQLGEALADARERGEPPVEAWSNVRLYRVSGGPKDPEGVTLMDTVGLGQLDRPDQEACFRTGRYEPSDVDGFLRSLSLYLVARGQVVQDGDTIDGPGGVAWRARSFPDCLSDPPRPVLRWLPQDGEALPPSVAGA